MSEPNAIPTHRAHEDAELTEAQLQELAGKLTRKRKEVSERIRSLEQQIAVRDDCSVTDAADAASLQESRLRANAVLQQHRQLRADIDEAFDRLRSGRYGVSESNGAPISYDRLRSIPWTRTAVEDRRNDN